MKNRKRRYYSLYKGDEQLAFGTAEEIAEKLGITPKVVYYYGTATYARKYQHKKDRRFLVRVDDIDEND